MASFCEVSLMLGIITRLSHGTLTLCKLWNSKITCSPSPLIILALNTVIILRNDAPAAPTAALLPIILLWQLRIHMEWI